MMPLCTTTVEPARWGGGVGMRVALGGLAVGGPARVPEAHVAAQRSLAEDRLEVAELPERAAHREAPVLEDRDAGGVVAAVLEAAQPADHHVHGLLFPTDVADDPAHASVSSSSSGGDRRPPPRY